jgi:cephalosporin-C deacetylase-like acetyl esterase
MRIPMVLSVALLGALLQPLAAIAQAPAGAQRQSPAQINAALPVRAVSPELFRVVSRFYDYDRSSPLNAGVISRQERPTYTREKVVFSGMLGSRVPAYLALPKTRTGRVPVVLLLDGIQGSKERWFEQDSWPRGPLVTDSLLAAGIGVLALDARYHGERVAESDFRAPNLNGAAFQELFIPTVIDYRRALDYLATRPEVDTARIGALGLSMGGMMSFALASLDPRVRVVAAGVTPVSAFKDADQIGVSPQTFAPYVRNVPVLMQMGRTDGFYNEADVQAFYNLIPGTRKELVWYDSGHRLPEEYAPRAVAWLKQYLAR